MSSLPNILPTAGTQSFDNDGAMTFSGSPEKAGLQFDHMMARALSPCNNAADSSVEQNHAAINDDNHSPLHPKNSKSSTPSSGKDCAKTTGGDSSVGANSSVIPDANVMAVHPEIILIKIVAPAEAKADQKCESSAKTEPDLLSARSKAATTNKSAEIVAALSEAKKPSVADTKVSIPPNSQNQPGVDANSAAKAGSEAKIAEAVEALAVAKKSSTASKICGLTAGNPPASPLAKDATGDLMTPKLAVEPVAQLPEPKSSVPSDLDAKTVTQAQPQVNGTTVAQQDVQMKNLEKTNKTASSVGKILPGGVVSGARADKSSVREDSSTLVLRTQIAAAVATSSSSPDRSANFMASSADLITSPSVSDLRSRALERTQDMVVLHAGRLSESGNSSLQVVIKPGAGTELSLELRQRGDGVEAQAVLQRGDFEHLKQHWPALQQQLEQRGIRLSPLVSDGNFVNSGSSHNFQNQQNQSAEPESFPVGAFAALAPTAATAGTHRGWESWA